MNRKSPKRNAPPNRREECLAAVDVGSNAIRLLIARTTPEGYTVLSAERSPVRLGHGVYLSGNLSPKAADAAVAVLRGFVSQMKAMGVHRHRAVATSAVRESENGESFVERARSEAGLELDVIGGAEEARLIHRAVSWRLDMGTGPWMLADLGGGSVEVSLADDAGILWSESHTMGAVRLLEALDVDEGDPGAFLALLEEYVQTLRMQRGLEGVACAGFAATGGNIEALAGLALVKPDAGGVGRLSVDKLSRVIKGLSALTFRARVEKLGLRRDRADVILPAAIVYRRLAQMAGVKEVVIPFVGIREGIILDLAAGRRTPGQPGDREERSGVVHRGALAVGRRYRFEEAHGLHVARMALGLFDQLRGLHGLGEEDRQVLLAAAILHDVGSFVSLKNHHKHSMYLIANADLAGLSRDQTAMAATVARYHRKSYPKLQHPSFAAIAPADRERVQRLSALLRLADAMDREHQQKVSSMKAGMERGRLVLKLEGAGDLLLESWALRRKADLFQKVYGLAVEVRTQKSGKGGASESD